jgi:zinc D-Ala-D-Ala carboxypeptidase
MRIWLPGVLLVLLLSILACSSPSETKSPMNPPSDDTLAAKVDSPIVAIDTPAIDTIPLATLLGKINPAKDSNFVPIASKYTSKSGIYMRRQAYDAFERMHAAAAADGIKITIVSAMRTFTDQKGIWENKWTGRTLVGGKNLSTAVADPVERAKAILRYSSMPSTSRHHWGTDLDLNSLENSYFDSGTGKKLYEWLQAHAAEYGFCQPYSAMGPERPKGYQEERWHWSYMPVSTKFLKAYRATAKLEDINGFLGSETATPLNVIQDYVSGIAPPCRDWK